MASAPSVYASPLPTAFHNPFDPPHCTASAPLTAHAQTLSLPDSLAAIQPVAVPVPTCAPQAVPTAFSAHQQMAPTAASSQLYQMPPQQAMRHSAWQAPAWTHASINCSPAPPVASAPVSSPYVYPQPSMAPLSTTAACYEAALQQRFVDPSAGAFAAGSMPTVYGMPLHAAAHAPAHAQKMARDYRLDGTPIQKVRGDGRKCRKVYGMENRDKWCTQCRWKKACVRFVD